MLQIKLMVKKLRFYYLFLFAVLKKQWKKVLFVGLIVSILVISTFFLLPFVYKNIFHRSKVLFKQTYVEAIIGKPTTFNPLFSEMESEKEINSLIFRGLTRVAPDGSLVGDLAAKIEVKSSTEYVFNLKRDILWHDGKRFTADDVLYTVELSQNSLYQSKVASNFKDVAIKKLDAYTVSFKLKEPFSPFLTATTVGIIPKHIQLNNYRPIGTGKFRFLEIKEDSSTLESDNLKVKFKYYPSLEVAQTALKLGEVHAITSYDLSSSDLRGWKNFSIYQSILPYRLSTIFFNTRDEFLKDKATRQALAYSISKEDIVKIQEGTKGKAAVNSFAGVDFLSIDGKERYSYNLEKSKQLLQGLGWRLQDNLLYKNGKKFSLTITTLADSDSLDTAKKIQKSWRSLGIEVEINIVSGIELKEQIVPNKIFTVLLSSQLLNPDPDQYVLWHTTQTHESNITGITSPKLDKLLEDGRKSIDLNVRKEKYREFSRLISDEVPAVFLYYPRYVWVCSNRIKNIDLKDFREPQDRFLSSDKWSVTTPLF